MLGFAARTLGYVVLAAAMAVGVVDGARGIADGIARLSTLAAVFEVLFPHAFQAFGAIVGRLIHPALWDPVLTTLLLAPAAPALFAVGLGLLLAARRTPGAILPPQ